MFWSTSNFKKIHHNPLDAIKLEPHHLVPCDENWTDNKPPVSWSTLSIKDFAQDWVNSAVIHYMEMFIKADDSCEDWKRIKAYLQNWKVRQARLPGPSELKLLVRNLHFKMDNHSSNKVLDCLVDSLTKNTPGEIILPPIIAIIWHMEDLDRRFQSTPSNSSLWASFGEDLHNQAITKMLDNAPKASGGRPSKEDKAIKQAAAKEAFAESSINSFIKFEDDSLDIFLEAPDDTSEGDDDDTYEGEPEGGMDT